MLISEFKFRKPDTYGDIPKILRENNIINVVLCKKLVDLAQFRNVLVHEYMSLDREIVFKHLHKDPNIIKEFLNKVKDFIKKNSMRNNN